MTKSVKRLYTTFQPNHYAIHFIPNGSNMHFSGSVTISGKKVGRPSQRLTFHQNGLKITKASIVFHDKNEDTAITISRINHHATLHEVRLHSDTLLRAGEYTITMEFEAPITRGMTGIYPCFFKYGNEEKHLFATQFESHYAREAFPCIDEPEAKATFDLTLTLPKNYNALSNTTVKESVTDGDKTTTTFHTTPRMSTYLLAFVAGEIHNVSGETKNGVAVNVWGSAAQPKESFAFALDTAVKTIEFFEDYFKTPYPLEKCDHVALPDFSSGAMENWGLITYREAVLLLYPDAISQSSKETIALVIAHETAHQWFGNLVTMKWWDDLWLNESFANMMEYVAVDAVFPEWNIWESFVTAEGLSAFRRDATPGVQAVKTTVHHPDEISTIFDPSIVYAKGGRLLYMLKSYLGDEAFRTGLQLYFKKHAYKNTTGADLWEALSEASGVNVADFMNPWLEQSGFPVVSVDNKKGVTELTQEHFLDNREKVDNNRLWPVPLFIENADEHTTLTDASIEIASIDSALINSHVKGHYIVHYKDPEHKQQLVTHVRSGNLSVINRLMLLLSNSMLSRAGYQSYHETLTLLEAYSEEDQESVWDVMSLIIAETRRFIDMDESLEEPIKKYIRKLTEKQYQRLGWEEKADESGADKKLRANILGLGAYAENPQIVTHAKELFEAYKADASVVSAELRGIVFGVAVKENVSGAVEYLLDLYKTSQNSDLQRDISGALTITRSKDTARLLLSTLQDSAIVKPQDADRWAFFLLRNRYVRDTAWQWMTENWDWITDTYSNESSFDYWPRYAASICATKEWQKKYQEFWTPLLASPKLKRNIEIGFEEIQTRIDWLQRDIKDIQKYFK